MDFFSFRLRSIVVLLMPLLWSNCASSKAYNNAWVMEKEFCRNIPGDAGWPDPLEWARLNDTLDGRLIATNPSASVCHEPNFDERLCQRYQDEWAFSATFIPVPADFTMPYFQNQSCDPYTPRDRPCTLGNYPVYSANVTKVTHIQAAVNFARKMNIRLTIKNTGHDLLGKAVGKGSLSIWTHNLDSIEFMDHYNRGSSYDGAAVRLGAGVLTQDVLNAANNKGVRIVTGTCPTVGVAGGYASGGGHGAFTSIYGMAADNVLEWEVVTADGQHLVVTPTNPETSDLYWAISGGGAGTFAVVVSMTTRVYLDAPMMGTSFRFDQKSVGGNDKFWDAVTAFQLSLGSVTSLGAVVSYAITSSSLDVIAIAIPTDSAAIAKRILNPIITALSAMGLSIQLNITTHTLFLDFFNQYFEEIVTTTPDAQITGSRFFPRNILENSIDAKAVSKVMRYTVNSGFTTICDALNANYTPIYENAVLPAWRSTLMHCIFVQSWNFSLPWSEMVARQEQLTHEIMPQIEAITPGAGAYLNEANFEQPSWQEVFYGSNYPRLDKIKQQRDPKGVFYARTAVGSEQWKEDSSGRLCRM